MKNSKKTLFLSLLFLFIFTGCKSPSENSSFSEQTPTPASDISTVDIDEQYAQEVIDLINSLNSDSTPEDVAFVLSKYNDLTQRQKTLVTNYYLLEVFASVVIINDKLVNLDEEHYDIDEVMEIRELYDELCDKYGEEGISRINQSGYDKLLNIEVDITNKYINNALSIDVTDDINSSRFILLSNQVDFFYNRLDPSIRNRVARYEEYVEMKESLSDKGYLLYKDGYELCSSAGISQFGSHYDENFGMLYSHDGLNRFSTIEVDLDISERDWSKVYSMSFFLKSNATINDRTAIIINESWDEQNVIWTSPEVIDEANHLYYYHFSLDKITSAFNPNKKTYLQIYFGSSGYVNEVQMTNIVAINKDFSEVNAMVDKINQIDISTNMGKTQFLLQNQVVSSFVNELDREYIRGYDTYISKQAEVNNVLGLVYEDNFTTFFDNDFPSFTKTSSDLFGNISEITLSSSASTSIQIFADRGNRQNWSQYGKIAMFVETDCELDQQASFVINNTQSLADYFTPVRFGDTSYIYYLEFNLNTSSAFTGNPFVVLRFSGSLRTIKTTNWVGII